MRRTAIPAVIALGALAVICGSGCDGRNDGPPNVLLVVVDTLRADHTSLLGYERETTPHLDEFARDGLVFENARAASGWTKPSMASLLTGLSPAAHGVEDDEARLPETATTLAEVFWSAGYRTALLSDNPYVSRPFGFAQGYELVVDYASTRRGHTKALREHDVRDWAKRSGAVALNARLLGWLDSDDATRPWFAHVHYMEPHWPYQPPPAFHARFSAGEPPDKLANLWEIETGIAGFVRGRTLPERDRQALIDAYDASVAFWDARFGILLERMERRGHRNNTLIAVVSDHGEAFYEHSTWAHQNSLYDELVRVPVVVAGPGIAARRDPRDVAASDLAATLVQLAGLDPAALGSGRTLLEPEPTRWTARLERKGRLFHATIEAGKKWIVAKSDAEERTEAFELDRDPAEKRNQSSRQTAEASNVRARLLEFERSERSRGVERATATVSDELRDALRELGYAE